MPPKEKMARPPPWNGVDHWVLDKRVNLAMVGAFLLFCAVNIGSYFVLAYRVSLLEDGFKLIQPQQMQIIRLEDALRNMQERFDDKINTLNQSIHNGLEDIKRLVIAQWPVQAQSAPPRRIAPIVPTPPPPPR